MPVTELVIPAISPDCHAPENHGCEPVLNGMGKYTTTFAVFSIAGKDTLELFQRISTNDLAGMNPGMMKSTILLTEKGKIKGIATLVVRNNDILLISEIDDAESLKTWIETYIIMEDVSIADVSKDYSNCIIIGSYAGKYVQNRFSISDIDSSRANENYLQIPGGFILLNILWKVPCFTIFTKEGFSSRVDEDIPIPQIGENRYELARIENGVPRKGKELTEEFNPLEANLRSLVSFTKGCYIGQEVIARIDTYKKLQKILAGVQIETTGKIPERGILYQDNSEVGFVTSSAWSPDKRAVVALGYVKTSVAEGSQLYFSGEGLTEKFPARIIPLPIS
jgi:folate-binding protein YgfZ